MPRESVSPVGSTVARFDLRSDNFCFTDGDARLVDWSLACLGNPKIDLGLFLPGLVAENGPRPGELLPHEPGIASWVAGFFAWYASKSTIPTAPRVRTMQLAHLRAALPWATRALGLWLQTDAMKGLAHPINSVAPQRIGPFVVVASASLQEELLERQYHA